MKVGLLEIPLLHCSPYFNVLTQHKILIKGISIARNGSAA